MSLPVRLMEGEELPDSLQHLLSVRPDPSAPDVFHSVTKAIRLGNTQNNAYGGCIQGLCINAAAATVPAQNADGAPFGMHTFHGVFLGPLQTTSHVVLKITRLRSTRTFHTRLVLASQVQKPGSPARDVFSATVDFHALEVAGPGMTFGAAPRFEYSAPDACIDHGDYMATQVAEGAMPAAVPRTFRMLFGSMELVAERRMCPEGIAFQNAFGVDSERETTQDDLPLAGKTSAWWTRVKHPYDAEAPGSAAHRAGLAFFMDSATAFIALTHSKRFFDKVSACSSLDVSLRIVDGNFDLNEWMLSELVVDGGAEGRTVPVMRVWSRDGRLIAESTQNCIMRWRRDKPAKI